MVCAHECIRGRDTIWRERERRKANAQRDSHFFSDSCRVGAREGMEARDCGGDGGREGRKEGKREAVSGGIVPEDER